MADNNPVYARNERAPWVNFVMLLVFSFLGMFIFNFIGLLVTLPLAGFDLIRLTSIIEAPMNYSGSRNIIMIIQGVSAFGAFIVSPLIFKKYLLTEGDQNMAENFQGNFSIIVLTGLMTIVIMPLNGILVEWNEAVNFPSFLEPFEIWARGMEDRMAEITVFLTSFDSSLEFIAGLVVIAVIPAVGEELLFRGFLQPFAIKIFKNIHIGIFFTAFVFGAFHLQFFGMIPRVFLGMLFGYLYFWSGSLLYPIVAHFVNNGFTVLMIYLYKQDVTEFDIIAEENIPWYMGLMSLLLSLSLFYYFRQYFRSSASE